MLVEWGAVCGLTVKHHPRLKEGAVVVVVRCFFFR